MIKSLFRKEKVVFFLSMLVIGIVCFISINNVENAYLNQLLQRDNQILSDFLMKYPELEEDILNSYKNAPKTNNDILGKYGIKSGADYHKIDFQFQTIKYTLGILFLIVFCFPFLLHIIFQFRMRRELNAIDKYLHALLKNDYQLNLKEFNENHFSQIRNDLYQVTHKLKSMHHKSEKERLELEKNIADIMHQLKTPLASLYLINDVLNTTKDETTRKTYLKKNELQLEKMEWLVISLLKLTQLESGTIIFDQEKTSVLNVIQNALSSLQVNMELKNIDLKINCDKKIEAKIDTKWTSEALLNILKNAMEHTKDEILISVEDKPSSVEINIIDNGEGISKEVVRKIFNRFYTVSKDSNSIGIGLHLSKSIIEKQNGNIQVESKKGRTNFIIKLYKI